MLLKMKLRNISLYFLCLAFCFSSCKKDDSLPSLIPDRDRDEQQEADKDSIVKYLDNHYYNASLFDGTNPSVSSKDLVITERVDGVDIPDGHRLLSADIITKKLTFANTAYEIFYIDLNTGTSENAPSPNFSDNVLVNYEGFTLENRIFDSTATPVDFDLLELIQGWRKVLPEFRTSEDFIENEDGTNDFINSGVGIMFVPSGLAYFSRGAGIIPPYAPIIFKFDLNQMTENDHDNDNVPSYLEDWNTNDGEFTLNSSADIHDGDDTDNDGTPDYFDADDDGDGVPTRNEDLDGEDGKGDGDPTNDIGKNGIPKYLDPEEKESNGL
jgi:hypothetical protein